MAVPKWKGSRIAAAERADAENSRKKDVGGSHVFLFVPTDRLTSAQSAAAPVRGAPVFVEKKAGRRRHEDQGDEDAGSHCPICTFDGALGTV
jgi:hypothetical protein